MYFHAAIHANSARFERLDSKTTGAKPQNEFQNRLTELRAEMTAPKAETTANPQKLERQSPPPATSSANGTLFSAWEKDATIEESLEKLDTNLSKIGAFSLSSGVDVQEAIEHIASQYSVYKNHIRESGTADQLKQLTQIVEKHADQYAKGFSEIVGGFFEDNGLAGEKEVMYQSVKNRIELLSSSYDDFIAKNRELYAGLVDQAGRRGTSLSFALREEYTKDGDGELFYRDKAGYYKREELAGAVELVKFAKTISQSGEGEAVSEEELGVKFGKIALNGLSFLAKSKATGAHQQAFLRAVDARITQLVDASDQALESKRKSSDRPAAFPPLDRSILFAVISGMKDHYSAHRSVSSALEAGTLQGLQSFLTRSETGGDSDRYQSSIYWSGVVDEMKRGGQYTLLQQINIAFLNQRG